MRRLGWFLAVLLAAGPAFAEEGGGPWERFSVRLGGFAANMSTDVRIGTPGVGVAIDLEEVLGLDTSDSAGRMDANFRFGKSRRHALNGTWFDLSRENTKVLSTEIDVDGTVYPIGTTVKSAFDLAFYNVRYSYSFLHDDRVDMSFSAGLHVTKLGLAVSAAGIGDAGDAVTAPLPLIGIGLDLELTPKWFYRSSLEGLYIEASGFRGLVSDLLTGVEYVPFRRFSFGLGVNAVNLKVESESEDGVSFSGEAQSRSIGMIFYGKFRI